MYTHILMPIAPEHDETLALSLKAARKLLTAGGRITALTVLEPIPGYIAQYLPMNQLDLNRAETEARLRAEMGEVTDIDIRVEFGHAAQQILAVADEGKHDCIILASHKPGMQDYLLGSTAARVVRHAHCGVLVLR